MNTPYGRYRFTRMTTYGILSAQEVVHKRIYQHFIGGYSRCRDLNRLFWGTNNEHHERRMAGKGT